MRAYDIGDFGVDAVDRGMAAVLPIAWISNFILNRLVNESFFWDSSHYTSLWHKDSSHDSSHWPNFKMGLARVISKDSCKTRAKIDVSGNF